VRPGDPDQDEVAVLRDLEAVDEHFRRLLVGLVRCERREVAHADEHGGGGAHRVRVERLLDPPDIGLEERGLAPSDLVDVAPLDGIVPRVEAVRRLVDRADVDVGRQRVVEARAQHGRRQVRVELEVRDLSERVHAGVGPAGAVQLELLPPRRVADGAIDFAGDRPRVLLDLPAAVTGAVVFNQQLEARHRASGNLEIG
jgi:hypothetical protein